MRITMKTLARRSRQLEDVRYTAPTGQLELNSGEWYTAPVNLPPAGIMYRVRHGGLVEAAVKAFNVGRQRATMQLQRLYLPTILASATPPVVRGFVHTRYDHMLDAQALITLMLENNRGCFSATEYNTGRVAALTHDLFTPAGGDAMKHIDPDGMDEDLIFKNQLEKIDWKQFGQDYLVDEELLVSTVEKNQGKLGKLLDLADKTAYCARDLMNVLEHYRHAEARWHTPGVKRLQELARTKPQVAAIWDVVKVIGEEVVVTDAERMADLMELRVRLWRELYENPAAKFIEYIIGQIIFKELYLAKVVTLRQLMIWGDNDLNSYIDTVLGKAGSAYDINCLGGPPRLELFKTRGEAKAREAELDAAGLFSFLVDRSKRKTIIKPETHYLVETADSIKPLREALPERAKEIEAVADIERLHLFWIKDAVLHPTFAELHRRFKERQNKE